MSETTHALSFEADTKHLLDFFSPLWKLNVGEKVKAYADERGLRLVALDDNKVALIAAHTTEVEGIQGEGLIRCDTADLKRVFTAAAKVGDRAEVRVGDTLQVKVGRSIYRAPLLAEEVNVKPPELPADVWLEVDSDRLKEVASSLKIAEEGVAVAVRVEDGDFFIDPKGGGYGSPQARGSQLHVCEAEGEAKVYVSEDYFVPVVKVLRKGPVQVGVKMDTPLQFKQEWETGSLYMLIAPRIGEEDE